MHEKKAGSHPLQRIPKERLKELIGEATVDCYDESEQVSGFFTMIEDNLHVPFETLILGISVVVEQVDLNDREDIVVVCSRGDERLSIHLLDVPLPSPPPEGAEWIEAYRLWARG